MRFFFASILVTACVVSACGGSIAPVENTGNDGGSKAPPPSAIGGGCSATQACAAGGYCDVGATCGTTGTCTTVPTACTDIGQPVCGCDGVTYGNPCTAAGAGVSVTTLGPCAKPPPTVPPGQLFADGDPDVCAAIEHDVSAMRPVAFDAVNLALLLGEIERQDVIAPIGNPEAAFWRIPQVEALGIFFDQMTGI